MISHPVQPLPFVLSVLGSHGVFFVRSWSFWGRLEAECLGVEDDFYAATPGAIAYFAVLVGWPSFFVVDSPAAATPVFLVLGGEDGLLDAMPDAIAYVAAMSWPSFFVDSPDAALPLMMFAALSGGSGYVACAAMVCAAIFWDGCRGVARLGLGPVIVASLGVLGGSLGPDCLQPYPGGLAALVAEFLVGTGAVSSSSSEYEWVEIGRGRV